jgi:hypothetical protein
MPTIPQRSEVPEEELAIYDKMVTVIPGLLELMEGRGRGATAIWGGLLISPRCSEALWNAGGAALKQYNKPNTWTPYLHEWIDLVLSVATGVYVMQEEHTPNAVASGIRIEAVEALCAGRDEDLTNDELEIVTFIRRCIDGDMTDDSWKSMRRRIGSERGVVEYVWFIMDLLIHFRLCQIFDAPGMSEAEHRDLIGSLRAGTYELPDLDAYHARLLETR